MAPRLFAAPLRLAPALLIAAASICSSATVAVVPPPIAEAADDAAAPAAAAAAAAPAAADDLAGAASDVAVFAKMELPIPAALPPLKPTFLIGTGYCREAGEEHDTFESWADTYVAAQLPCESLRLTPRAWLRGVGSTLRGRRRIRTEVPRSARMAQWTAG